MRRLEIVLVSSLLLAYLLMGTLFAVRTPAWQAPDEPAHYNYIRQLIEGTVPVIELGDWDQDYLGEVVTSRFDPAYNISVITYEDWQPPLYYLLQTPVYRATGGLLTGMRLFSVLLGWGVVVLGYLVARRVFEGRIWPALAAAVFIAFVPQHLAMLSSVNNDSLAELIIAAILLLLITPWPDDPQPTRLLGLGLLLGAGFLTKGTVYLLAPIAGVFILARYWMRWRPMARALMLVFIPAITFGGLWWARNTIVYEGFDILARNAHDAIVIGQPRTVEWFAAFGPAGTVIRFVRTTFNSFWGQFGWMAAPLPGWMYGALLVLTLAALTGLVLLFVLGPQPAGRRNQMNGIAIREASEAATRRLQIMVLGLTFLLTLGLHVAYNLTFVQHQGRYLYPALIPIAIGFSAGLGYWLRPLEKRWPESGFVLPLGLFLLLAGISLYAVWRILPGLAPG
jgi:4-amino-4-deoxy-L-arabinose transferase-like glycosyltransferase